MKVANKEISVKLVGNFKTPEVKALLSRPPQKAFEIFSHSKSITLTEGKENWATLEESEKQPFVAASDKQRDLATKIKVLAKQHYSLTQALASCEQSLKAAKEEYLGLNTSSKSQGSGKTRPQGYYRRGTRKSKGKQAFEAFSAKWQAENCKTEEMTSEQTELQAQAWKSLTSEEKKQYYN